MIWYDRSKSQTVRQFLMSFMSTSTFIWTRNALLDTLLWPSEEHTLLTRSSPWTCDLGASHLPVSFSFSSFFRARTLLLLPHDSFLTVLSLSLSLSFLLQRNDSRSWQIKWYYWYPHVSLSLLSFLPLPLLSSIYISTSPRHASLISAITLATLAPCWRALCNNIDLIVKLSYVVNNDNTFED